MDNVVGILNIYKEAGMTSHDVVAILRGILHQKRIGHTGTLDPMVTGVLPICLGSATRLAESVSSQGKEYAGELVFGYRTDTLDQTGKVIARSDQTLFTRFEIEEAMQAFRGEIMQLPPMYSAVKVQGKRLYELARKGVSVERKPRPVTISLFEILHLEENYLSFRCRCSKGTYIRQLVDDLGTALGTYATMIRLERTAVGPFRIDQAIPISECRQMSRDELLKKILPPDTAVSDMPIMKLNYEDGKKAVHGANIPLPDFLEDDGAHRVYVEDLFLGIGNVQNGILHMNKVFHTELQS